MKKLILLSLSIFMLASTIQPALAMSKGLTEAQFKDAHSCAKWGAIKAGVGAGIACGLGNSLILSGLRKNSIGVGRTAGILGFNVVAPTVVGGVLFRPTLSILKKGAYSKNKENPALKVEPSKEQRQKLENTLTSYYYGTEILVIAGVTSALASGVMSGLLGETSSAEDNSVKNFCTVFPFALTIATVLRCGAWECAHWVTKK